MEHERPAGLRGTYCGWDWRGRRKEADGRELKERGNSLLERRAVEAEGEVERLRRRRRRGWTRLVFQEKVERGPSAGREGLGRRRVRV